MKIMPFRIGAEMRMWKLTIYTISLEICRCHMQQHCTVVANKQLCEYLQ